MCCGTRALTRTAYVRTSDQRSRQSEHGPDGYGRSSYVDWIRWVGCSSSPVPKSIRFGTAGSGTPDHWISWVYEAGFPPPLVTAWIIWWDVAQDALRLHEQAVLHGVAYSIAADRATPRDGKLTGNGRRALLVPDRPAASAQGRVGDSTSSWLDECVVLYAIVEIRAIGSLGTVRLVRMWG